LVASALIPVQFSWTAFSIHWSTAAGLAILGGLYAWRSRSREGVTAAGADGSAEARAAATAVVAHPGRRSPTTGEVLTFAAGLVALLLVLDGPIAVLGRHYLFSARVTQHMLLAVLVAPLLIAGTPGWMFRPAVEVRSLRAVAGTITTGPWAFAIFNFSIIAWHLPVVYDAALASPALYLVQHFAFLAASILLWWPVMSRTPDLPPLGYPTRMLYLFLNTLPLTVTAVVISLSGSLLYNTYVGAPRVWPVSPIEDQRLGGLIMWLIGSFVLLGAMSVTFFRWVGQAERLDGQERAELV
jgi:putative membrane protein